MCKSTNKYNTPIWLSDWTLEDKKGFKYLVENVIVKGENKGKIFLDQDTVNKVVRKLIGGRKKHTLKATNLTLKSQHGYGIED